MTKLVSDNIVNNTIRVFAIVIRNKSAAPQTRTKTNESKIISH